MLLIAVLVGMAAPGVVVAEEVAQIAARDSRPQTGVKNYPATSASVGGATAQGNYAQVDPNKVIEEADLRMQKNPSDASAYDMRGSAYNNLEQFENAVKDFNEAIRLDPNRATAYAGRAYALYKQEKYQDALKDCNEALRINPNLSSAYTCRGNVYSKLEQYQKSMQDLNKGLSVENHQGGLVSRSRTHYLMGNYKAAVADATAAIAKNPRDPVAWDNRGVAYHELKSFQLALSDYNKALSLRPGDPKYTCHRGITYAEMGKTDLAIADFDYAISKKPDFALAYFDRGICHLLCKEYEKATNDFQQAIHYDPHYALALEEFPLDPVKGGKAKQITQPEEYYYRACSHILMKRNQTALHDLRKYLDMTNWKGNLAASAVILSYLGYTLNHDSVHAQEILGYAALHCDPGQWPYPVIRYFKHEIKLEELMAEATDNDKLSDVHGFVGIDMALNGQIGQAMPHLKFAVDNGAAEAVSHTLSVREVEKTQFKKHRETERT